MALIRLPFEDVKNPEALAAIVGPIEALECSPLDTVGFTEARHERLILTLHSTRQRRFVIKTLRLSANWTARRSADLRGREAALLEETSLEGIWGAFACPYVAYATEDDRTALVMNDLSAHLFPDVREPLSDTAEERLLGALASLHAHFWSSPITGLPWLTQPEQYAGLLDADCAADAKARTVLPEPLRDNVVRGWSAAISRLPADVAAVLTMPAAEMSWLWSDLPWTLLHGDTKVANFALLEDRRVAAFDWALLGAGPATLDLGWYLAVNSTRLSGSKEETFGRYRVLLSERMASALPDALWERLVRVALIVGARMLLWSKALAVEADRPGARTEWAWWIDRLEAACG